MDTQRSKPLVSVIIVNWNGKKWLEGCLETLSRQTYRNREIILVDNASEDGSVPWVGAHHPETNIIVNRENLGFSHANNIGYHAAKGEYILFLNNDTESEPDMISELVKVLESDPGIGGAQAKILLMADRRKLDSIGAFLTPTGFLFHNHFMQTDRTEYDRQIDLYTAKGACMMFKNEVLQKVEVNGEIFDPDYFAYFEETDLCHRIWLSGYRTVYAFQAVCYHRMGATSTTLRNTFVQYHSFKNRISSYAKNLGAVQCIRILPVHVVLCIGIAYMQLFRGNLRYFAAIHRSLLWNMLNLTRTLEKRAYIQSSIRIKADSEIMPGIMKSPGIRYYLKASRYI